MENKYYKPDLEEFHLGFEYEAESTRYPDRNNWHPETFYLNKGHLNLVTINTLYHNKVRVKYLDKEDIESLGFIHEGGKLSMYGSQYYIKTLKDAINHDTIIRLEKTQGIIQITTEHEGGMDSKPYVLFNGFCKNKSELKRILKQIGVCQ